MCVWQTERKKQRRTTTSSYTHTVSNFIEHIELHPCPSAKQRLLSWPLKYGQNAAVSLHLDRPSSPNPPSPLGLQLPRTLPWLSESSLHSVLPTTARLWHSSVKMNQRLSFSLREDPKPCWWPHGMSSHSVPTCPGTSAAPPDPFKGPPTPGPRALAVSSTFRWNPHGSLLCLLRVSAQKSSTENTLPGLVPRDTVTQPHQPTISSTLCGCLSPFLSHSCHQTDYRLRVIMFCLPDCWLGLGQFHHICSTYGRPGTQRCSVDLLGSHINPLIA